MAERPRNSSGFIAQAEFTWWRSRQEDLDYRSAMKVLVTGGAGYIGSVTATGLEQAGHIPVILDSLISGPGDIADRAMLSRQNGPDVAGHPHRGERVSGGQAQAGGDVRAR